MHKIQQHVLKELILNPSRRYSQIKPAGVESNLFMYHLRQLTGQGLVQKQPDGSYVLTEAGQSYADQLSLKTFMPRLQPRIVTLLLIKNHDDRFLLYRRNRQPLIGMVGFPYGKVHVGETIAEAAHRELKEKTGLMAQLTHRGDGYLTMTRHDQAVSQILFHLFTGENPEGRLLAKNKLGQPFWGDPTQVPGWELMPSVLDLIELSAVSPQRFFLERTYQLDATSAKD